MNTVIVQMPNGDEWQADLALYMKGDPNDGIWPDWVLGTRTTEGPVPVKQGIAYVTRTEQRWLRTDAIVAIHSIVSK